MTISPFDPTFVSITLKLTVEESQEVLRALAEFRKAEALRTKAIEVLNRENGRQWAMTDTEKATAAVNKIAAIKLVRERLQCGLKEAKDIVEESTRSQTHERRHLPR